MNRKTVGLDTKKAGPFGPAFNQAISCLVHTGRLELPRDNSHRLLRPARLPISPRMQVVDQQKREPANWRFLLHKGKIFILKFRKARQKNYSTFTAASSTIGFKLRLEYLSSRRKPYTPKITHRKPAEKPAITSVAK